MIRPRRLGNKKPPLGDQIFPQESFHANFRPTIWGQVPTWPTKKAAPDTKCVEGRLFSCFLADDADQSNPHAIIESVAQDVRQGKRLF